MTTRRKKTEEGKWMRRVSRKGKKRVK